MVQPVRTLRQAVRVAQPGPAVGALHELVAQAQLQGRMPAQVGQFRNAKRSGAFFAHAQRIRVVETERRGHREAAFGKRRLQRGAIGARHMQQFLGEGAGVFGIGIDGAVFQRTPENAGASELALVLDFHACLRTQPRRRSRQGSPPR